MIQESSADKRQSLYLYTDEGSYELLARIDRNGNQEQHIYYFHTDLNGLPEELTDEAGEIVWECSYQLWGKPIQEIAHTEIQQNLRYQGQYLDRETGLHYNTFRYYDPDIGRFTQPDPIGLLGGYNLYQYAPNPLMWVDPLGWYAGEGERELGKYHVFHQHTLDPSEYGLSDREHFRRGNKSIYERLQNDPAFRREMQTKYPGVVQHVQPNSKGNFSGKAPPGLTWHHENKDGVLSLVDHKDHKTYNKIYHPDGSGGRYKWGGGTTCRK
ncbi:RHS repeat-associated core domain-containing protein [Snodgrassella alvi]|uniref:RHS repeat-associated core domain-containing protein n=1 Tax=Snodgrassella alvi TaxID=1196083 RepID=UPI00351C72BA